ncbi:MAG: hypothetical protein J1E79_01805 [Rikenella sp.]|nr:hypothetical protein [Rikenella sp.]
MNIKDRIDEYLIPMLYTVVWGVGLYTGIFEEKIFRIQDETQSKLLAIVAVYCVFLMELLVGFIDIARQYKTEPFSINVIWAFCIAFGFTLVVLILVFWGSSKTEIVLMFILIAQKFEISYINHSVERFLYKRVLIPNKLEIA